MNTGLLKELRLDPETISRDSEVSLGLARVYKQQPSVDQENNFNRLAIAATYFRRAAANSLLLGENTFAQSLFGEASAVYQRLGLPYSVAIAALSSERRSLSEEFIYGWPHDFEYREVVERAIPQLAYVVLAQASLTESRQVPHERIINIRKELEPYRLRSLGVLGVPVGTILDLYDALVPTVALGKIELAESLMPFFGVYNTAIRQTSQNRYHWERLALPFHPAEPDIFSILTLANYALQIHHDSSVKRFIEQAPIALKSRYLLSTILEAITGDQDNRSLNR